MNLLLIANIAPHYRKAIFQLIETELGADFVFGDKVDDIKSMDYQQLSHKVTIVKNVKLWHCYYQRGILRHLFGKYDTFLMTGECRCISTWLSLLCVQLMPHKRSFLWTHGWLGKEGLLKRIVYKIFYSLADGVFVYNSRSKELMLKGGVPMKKISVIHNSLDYDSQLVIRKGLLPTDIYKCHFGNDFPVIIFIGRLTEEKRLDILIEAMDMLHNRGECYNLVLVGDGCQRGSLEKLAMEKHLCNAVWFCGACYDERKNAEYLNNADLCVSPGNVGLTAIHAMTYGCPVITNDDFNRQMPEFETIQKGESGDFFRDGDPSSLAETISSWFREHPLSRESIRYTCYKIIDEEWNPHFQIGVLKNRLDNACIAAN